MMDLYNRTFRPILQKIWFGSMLPEKYQNYILQFKEWNPAYRVIIWTDFNTLEVKEIQDFIKFCEHNKFLLKNIREYPHLINFDLIIEELNAAQRVPREIFRYARASDIARISILINQGGVYADTDTKTIKEIYNPDLPFGFIIKCDIDFTRI